MVVVNDTAVTRNGNVNAGLLEISVSLGADLNKSRRLTATDSLGLTGDTDRTAADTDLDKVSTAISEEAEACRVNYVTCADLNAVAVIVAAGFRFLADCGACLKIFEVGSPFESKPSQKFV